MNTRTRTHNPNTHAPRCLQGVVQKIIAIINTSKDASFLDKAKSKLEKSYQKFYMDALEVLAKALRKKLDAIFKVC